MTAIHISLSKTYDVDAVIEVDQWEGQVHISTTIEGEQDQPSLTPDAARALAAVLIHQATEADR